MIRLPCSPGGTRPWRRARRAAVVLGWALAAPLALAGDFHTGATLRCSDCHVMHFSQQHGYDPRQGAGLVRLGGLGPNKSLLRNGVNDLCLSCHDNSPSGTDVLDAVNTGSQPGIVRAGGFLNRVGNEALPHGGHTLDSLDFAPNSQPPWSAPTENGPGVGLTCINCHDPHGAPGSGHPTGSQYRNLRSNPGRVTSAWVTYNHTQAGVDSTLRDVFERQFASYDEARVDWNEPRPSDSAIARWCGGCHTSEHGNTLAPGGSGGGSGGLGDHPVWGENLDSGMLQRLNAKTNRVKVMSQIGVWFPAGRDVTPTCVTCHRSHGNANPRGLIFRSGTGTPTENGDSNGSSQANLCLQCHDTGNPH
jgi:hypothetical protein